MHQKNTAQDAGLVSARVQVAGMSRRSRQNEHRHDGRRKSEGEQQKDEKSLHESLLMNRPSEKALAQT